MRSKLRNLAGTEIKKRSAHLMRSWKSLEHTSQWARPSFVQIFHFRSLTKSWHWVRTGYLKRLPDIFNATFLFSHVINISLTEPRRSVWENLELGRWRSVCTGDVGQDSPIQTSRSVRYSNTRLLWNDSHRSDLTGIRISLRNVNTACDPNCILNFKSRNLRYLHRQ